MRISTRPCGLLLCGFLLSSASLAMGQQTNTQIKKVPAPYTSPVSGRQMYISYCAACHGNEGKGDGPATPGLKAPPPDLTSLAKRQDGKFPGSYVVTVLRNGAAPIHGTVDMPIWGALFGAMDGKIQDSPEVRLRISNVTKYLESIQSK
jgi:mono/diheme cytochrome c family protein